MYIYVTTRVRIANRKSGFDELEIHRGVEDGEVSPEEIEARLNALMAEVREQVEAGTKAVLPMLEK